MINEKSSLDQLPKEIKPAFQELNVIKHLNNAALRRNSASPVRICFGSSLSFSFTRRIGFVCWKAAKVNLFRAKMPSTDF